MPEKLHSAADTPFYEHPYGFTYYIIKYATGSGFDYKEFLSLEEAKEFLVGMQNKLIKIIRREVIDESLF